MQHEGLTHQRLGDGEGVCDVGQLGIEHAGKGEQVVALVLQGDPHRADAPRVLGLAGSEFGDKEVEQLAPGRQVRAGQSQDVMAQPVHEGADVAGELARLGFGLARTVQLGSTPVVWIALASTADPGPQCLAPRRGALGQAGQHVGQAFALALDVEHVAMVGYIAPGCPPLCPARRPCAASAMVWSGRRACAAASSRCTPQVSALRRPSATRRQQKVDWASTPASTGAAPWKTSSCKPTRMPDRSWSRLIVLACGVTA